MITVTWRMHLPRDGSGTLSVTGFESRFPRPDLLRTYADVPGRKSASIRIWFDQESQHVMATVTDSNQLTPLFRTASEVLEFSSWKLGWRSHEILPSFLRNEKPSDVICYLTMLSSGLFCGGQAFSDWEEFRRDPIWESILDDAKHMYCAAVVMLG